MELFASLKQNYRDVQLGANSIVDDWFLMKTPATVIAILFMYLLFILKLGPSIMSTRKAFTLKYVLMVYNVYQVFFSLWMCAQVIFALN